MDALYYPHIHFRSRRWLRMAMLYYDSVTRIVPDGLEPDDISFYREISPDPQALLDDIKELRNVTFIRQEPPNSVAAVGNEFFDFLAENLQDTQRRAQLFPQLNSKKTFYTIHPAKIDEGLTKILLEANLMHRRQGDSYSNYDIEPVTGGLYMLFLANRMAGNRPLVSDSVIYQSLMYTPLPVNTTIQHDDRAFRLSTAVLKTAVPMDLEHVKLETLLRLRSELSKHRLRFQDKMAVLGKDLAGVGNTGDLQSVIDRHKRSIEDEQEDLKDKMRLANFQLGQGLFALSIPAYLTAPWGMGLTSGMYVIGAAALAISGVAMKYLLDQHSARKPSAATYLLQLRKGLPAETAAKQIIELNLTDNVLIEDLEHKQGGGRTKGGGGGSRRQLTKLLEEDQRVFHHEPTKKSLFGDES